MKKESFVLEALHNKTNENELKFSMFESNTLNPNYEILVMGATLFSKEFGQFDISISDFELEMLILYLTVCKRKIEAFNRQSLKTKDEE